MRLDFTDFTGPGNFAKKFADFPLGMETLKTDTVTNATNHHTRRGYHEKKKAGQTSRG